MNNVGNVGMANIPMVPGPAVGPPMAMMNNGGAVAPPAVPRPQQQPINEGNKHLLNTYIYEYFLRNEMYDCARALLASDPQIKVQDGPNTRRDENGNIVANGESMDVDSKDGIDSKGSAEGLPQPSIPNPSMDNPFLYEWFCLFWDMFNAQKGKSANNQVQQYINFNQASRASFFFYPCLRLNQSRMRQTQQQEMLRNMRPDMAQQQQQMQLMRMQQQQGNGLNVAMKNPNNMAQRAMANSQNNPQMMHMLQQQQKQGQMQRDPSEMDGNRARASSPGSAENAPSPSKRIRLNESAPFNPGQGGAMPNGRPAGQGMPGQQVGVVPPSSSQKQHMQSLQHLGTDLGSLKQAQMAAFQSQSPAVQNKQIIHYAQNLQQQQQNQMPKQVPNATGPPGQGSPMVPQGPDGAALNNFYNAEGMGAAGIRPPGGPNASQQPGGSNHALQDYQMQLMLLEQQNKKRLMMARQEQDGSGSMGMPRDGSGGPGGPGGPPPGGAPPFQGTSPPQGARPGASPNPTDMKRGPPQMNPAGMGSPMAEGAQSRGSPNAMTFMGGQMDPNQNPQFNMNGMAAGGNMPGGPHMNGLRPPSSHPQPPFNGPMNPQQQQQMMAARQPPGQMPGQPGQQMQWQQQPGGPPGPNGNQMVPQGQTPQVAGTPQQRNAMPPPAQPAAAAAAANARNTSSPQVSTAAPPTPSQQNKAAPKKNEKKSAKDKRAAAQKKSNANLNTAGATPVAEPVAEAEAPTPATPITPVNPQQGMNRPGQNAVPNQPMPNGAPAPVQPPAAQPMVPQADPNQTFNMDGMTDFGMEFANPLHTSDVLNDFDFDSFLHDNEGGDAGFDFSGTGAFMDADGIET